MSCRCIRLAHSHSDAVLAAILAFIRSESAYDGSATDGTGVGDGLPYGAEIGHQVARLDPGEPAQPLVWGR